MNLEETINYNLQSDFEVLSDFAFYNQNKIFLGKPFRKEQYNSKIFRSDMDGVWEEGKKLCDIILEKMCEENIELKQNKERLYEIYEKPVAVQEQELLAIYQQCHLTAKQIFHANKMAANEFIFGKNSLQCISSLRKAGYRFLEYSGSFAWLIVQKDNVEIDRYPLALQKVWNRMGIPQKQIHGSEFFCNEKGEVIGLDILIEERKGKVIEKELYEPWMYTIALTDKISSDSSMVEGAMLCGLDILPVAMVVEEFEAENLPHGLMIYCPEGKEDKMEIFNRVMKIERGLIECLGTTEEQRIRARCIAKEIKNILENNFLTMNEINYLACRDDYIKKCIGYLDLLKLEFPKGSFNLFPERLTGIRRKLDSLKNENSFELGKELFQETLKILKGYSPL